MTRRLGSIGRFLRKIFAVKSLLRLAHWVKVRYVLRPKRKSLPVHWLRESDRLQQGAVEGPRQPGCRSASVRPLCPPDELVLARAAQRSRSAADPEPSAGGPFTSRTSGRKSSQQIAGQQLVARIGSKDWKLRLPGPRGGSSHACSPVGRPTARRTWVARTCPHSHPN